MSEYVKIRLYVGTGYAGCDHEDVYEYPREEWEAMSKEQQEELLNELVTEYLFERCECAAWVEED